MNKARIKQLQRKIREAWERSERATTNEDYIADMYVAQQATEELLTLGGELPQ